MTDTLLGRNSDPSSFVCQNGCTQRIRELEAEVARLNEGAYEIAKQQGWTDLCNADLRDAAIIAHRRAEVAEAKCEALEADLKIADDMGHELDEKLHWAEAKLRAVGELPDKWRKAYSIIRCAPETGIAGIKQENLRGSDCADELEAVLKDTASGD